MKESSGQAVFTGPTDVVADVELARAYLFGNPARHTVAQRGFDLRIRFDELFEESAETQKLWI